MRLFAVLTATVLFLAGCTSYRRQADDYFLNGEYYAATSLYERALQEDPKDEKAKAGLFRARRALIDERLLEVRQQRLSDNFNGALDRLLWIIEREGEWSVSPSGPAFSTQEEEVALLFTWLNSQAREAVNRRLYLKAKIFTDKYHNLFTAGKTSRRFDNLAKFIHDGGAADCRQFKSTTAGSPFSREFAQRYCMVWGMSDSSTNDQALTPASYGLPAYGQILIEGTLEDLPAEVLSAYSDSLLQGLKETPFYQAKAPALKIGIKGHFISRYDEHQSMAVHSYTVQVPYQVTNTVSYQVQVPYTAYRSEYDYKTNSSRSVPYTEYRSETRYREETETRYRSEGRSLPYVTTEFTVRYGLSGFADLTIDKVAHHLPLDEDFRLTDSYHETSNPSIGLYPKRKEMPTEVDWLKEKFQKSGALLSLRISEAWDSKYCVQPKNLVAIVQSEAVMKCLKGTRSSHEFVENWFTNRFGLSYQVVKIAMGGVSLRGSQIAGNR